MFIDGHDVNELPIRCVRGAAAYVPQDNFLFSDTVENNIAFACDERGGEEQEEAAREAAKLAAVHDNIAGFKDGYRTVLGERGVTVSGGQKQRISIARALMKQAKILILDDSVSAVDTKTEQAILENLRKNRAGLTTILIAHRISTVEGMDKIIFIDDGRVVAVGRHEELYRSCPAYRKWWICRNSKKRGGRIMREYYPLLIAGGIIGTVSVVFLIAYAMIRNKKEALGFDRTMKDGEIVRRLLVYAKPYRKSFLFVGFCMLFPSLTTFFRRCSSDTSRAW